MVKDFPSSQFLRPTEGKPFPYKERMILSANKKSIAPIIPPNIWSFAGLSLVTFTSDQNLWRPDEHLQAACGSGRTANVSPFDQLVEIATDDKR